jgi:spore germination cell wall hydrolase CwlJ-like protein
MRVARGRSKGAQASFGLAIVLFGLAPVRVGPQDLASLLARQPGVTERWREHLAASPFSTIHAATFSFPRPIGTAIPEPIGYRLASLGSDVTGSFDARVLFDSGEPEPLPFPSIDRTLKGDRLVAREPEADETPAAQTEPGPNEAPAVQSAQPEGDRKPASPGKYVVASASPVPDDVPAAVNLNAPISVSPPETVEPGDAGSAARTEPTQGEPSPADLEAAEQDMSTPTLDDDVSPAIRTARIYFGGEPMGGMAGGMQPWGPDQRPIFEDAGSPPTTQPGPSSAGANPADKIPPAKADEAKGGESVAGKGEVTGVGRRPRSPAERLGLAGKSRVKAEKCLADAVYFESRGESARGQIAVAQVVMNRVFSGYYPDNVCGVVYQNANRHLACQFTFACDGIPDRVTEPDAWDRAKRIARDTLDGRYWLNDVGKATHYHAYWVHPWWVHEMRKLDRIGVHTFYRPRKWGDGSDMPIWGDAAATKEAAKKL